MIIDPHDEARWDALHEEAHKKGENYNRYAEEVEKEFPRHSLICELGGGTGEDALYFLHQGHSVVILDISQFALQKAIDKATEAGLDNHIEARQIDFGYQTLPLNSDSINIAYSRISLNYFPREQTIKVFSEIFRVLKPGGKAYLTLKSPDDEKEMERLKGIASVFEEHVFIDGGQLRSRYPKEALEAMLTHAGINTFSVEPQVEDLGVGEHEKHEMLYVNEIRFTK